MFKVYDNSKPAKYPDHNVDPSWDNCEFETFEDAHRYANYWLGCPPDALDYGFLEVNVPYEYNPGCFIWITED